MGDSGREGAGAVKRWCLALVKRLGPWACGKWAHNYVAGKYRRAAAWDHCTDRLLDVRRALL